MEIFVVYAIRSLNYSRIYVGMTSNLTRRLSEHNHGYVRSTKAYIPWELIFIKEVPNRIEARRLEKYYKSVIGKEFLKSLNLDNGPVVQRIE